MTRSQPRRSFGGHAVEESLRDLGFDVVRPGLAMVETLFPKAQPFDVVLAQNAWNVIPRHDFNSLASMYPASTRGRMEARRLVSRVNLRRARRIVCLTHSMAELVRSAVQRQPEVFPVTAPTAFLRGETLHGGVTDPPTGIQNLSDYVLIPGSVTWYKNPIGALEWMSENGSPKTAVFAGTTAMPGCRAQVEAAAARQGVTTKFCVMRSGDLRRAYARAAQVVLPSRLESLGFGLAEALLHAPSVAASTVPAHREVAEKLGARWTSSPDRPAGITQLALEAARVNRDELVAQWHRLGEGLDLSRVAGSHGD